MTKGVIIGLVVVIAGGLIWYLTSGNNDDIDRPIEIEQADPLATTSEGEDLDSAVTDMAEADGSDAEEVVDPYDFGPPLQSQEEADDFLRESFLNKDTLLDDLLSRDLVLDKLVAGADAIWRDENPAPALFFWRAPGKLEVRREDGKLYLDSQNYARYAGFVKAFDAIPEEHLMKVYTFLLPLCRAAHERLGNTHVKWDELVPQTFDKLMAMEVPEGDIQLSSAGKSYIFTDSKLEKLSPANKVLLRMGPEQAKTFQEKLKRLSALLPAPVAKAEAEQ